MLGKGHGGLFNALTKEERKNERLRLERDQIKFMICRYQINQFLTFVYEGYILPCWAI